MKIELTIEFITISVPVGTQQDLKRYSINFGAFLRSQCFFAPDDRFDSLAIINRETIT